MISKEFHPENFLCSMFSKKLNGEYVWVNRALLRKHALKLSDIVGKHDIDLPWKAHSKLLRANDEEVIDGRCQKVFKETASRNGSLVKGLCQKSPILDKQAKIIGISGVWIDAPIPSLFQGLSLRERQCLEDVVSGKTCQESADRLGLSRR